MTNLKQYAVSILLIAAIAAIDKYLIIESQSAPTDMVWIEGSDFTTSTQDNFTDRDPSQDFQLNGFWIDESVVARAKYNEFLDKTGYISTVNLEQADLLINLAGSHLQGMEQVFALHDATKATGDVDNLLYISAADALAYCNWKGMDLSSKEQNTHMTHNGVTPSHQPASADITLHAAHPMSSLGGFRCVQLAN